MNRRMLVFVVLGAALLVLRYLRSSGSSDGDPPPPSSAFDSAKSDGGWIVPAAMADSEEALRLRVEAQPAKGGKRLLLEAGGGAAILTIVEPREAPRFAAFGRCTLEAPDRARGTAFVRAVARWLHQPDGAGRRPENPLAPVKCTYTALGDGTDGAGQTWVVRKLFLDPHGDGDTAEIYLRTSPDDRRAELLEKDEDYRGPVVAALAYALRDGPTPRRTVANDPNLATDEPLVGELAPMAGAEGRAPAMAWTEKQLFVATSDAKQAVLRSWERLDAPPREMGRIDGHVEHLAVDPKLERIAASVVFPQDDGVISSSDPGAVFLVDVATGRATRLLEDAPDLAPSMGTVAAWSPRGDALVIATSAKSADGGRGGDVAVVVDAKTGKRTHMTSASVDARPEDWDEAGVHLVRFDFDKEPSAVHLLWQPGKGEPAPSSSAPDRTSPDGKYRLKVDGKALVVGGPGGERRFTSARDEDGASIAALSENEPDWLGPHGLVMHGEDLMVLDLETLKLRFLLPEGDFRLDASSPDGKTVVVTQDDERRLWARVR